MLVCAADRITARSNAIDLVNRVTDDNGLSDNHVFHGMRIADGRRDAAGHVRLVQLIGARSSEHLVLDDGAALNPHVAVGHVQSTTTPVADVQQIEQERRKYRRFDEIPRERAVVDMDFRGSSDATSIRIDAPAVGKKSGDAIFRDRRLTDRRNVNTRIAPTDGENAASGRAATVNRIAADNAVIHHHGVCVDAAAVGSAVTGRIGIVTHRVIIVDGAVAQGRYAPDRNSRTSRKRRCLIVVRVLADICRNIKHAVAARDRHVRQPEIPGHRKDPRGVRTIPVQRDAVFKIGRINDDVLVGEQRRSPVIPDEVADEKGDVVRVVKAHHLTDECRVFFTDEQQIDRAAIEGLIEIDPLAG